MKKEYLIYKLSDTVKCSCRIDNELFTKFGVKRGLRNEDGSGVLVGLTNIGNVVGYARDKDGKLLPTEGKLFYRGYELDDLVTPILKEKRFGFEEVAFLLLSGYLPDREELTSFRALLNEKMPLDHRTLVHIIDLEGSNIMNILARCVLEMYTFDANPDDISRTNFDFYGTKLSGATEQRERWKRGVGLAENHVGEEIGQEFVARHFAPEYKAHMLELVDYLLAAYKERISALPWMTEETREKALVKLSKFRAKIGYPEVWRSFEGLSFNPSGASLVANARAGSAFTHDYELGKLGKPVDRDEWVTTPQTVNAFYHPVLNDVTFPAAILRPPFYSPDADAATNFGAIGAVIGHEIGHGFDDQGSQYDGDGNLNSWWSDKDRTAFEELTGKLVTQFDGKVPAVLADTDSKGVNGKFTLGENIGDLGGLGIAVVAYKRYLADHGKDFSTTERMTVDIAGSDPSMQDVEYNGLQRLFLSWARIWRTKIRPELATQYLAVDPHSPAEFRCNIIAANVAEFYDAFDVDPESGTWIAPNDRVTIW